MSLTHTPSGPPTDTPSVEAFSALLHALYAFAADPTTWENLLLSMEGIDSPDMDAFADHLDQALKLHSRTRFKTQQQPRLGETDLTRELVVVTANEGARETLARLGGRAAVGLPLHFETEENAKTLKTAARDLEQSAKDSRLLRLYDAAGRMHLCALYLMDDKTPGWAQHKAKTQEGLVPSHTRFKLINTTTLDADGAVRAIQDHLELTAAEARLATKLGAGVSIHDAAADLHISINTARNQLQSIFSKLGINRQPELVKVIIDLAVVGQAVRDTSTTALETSVPAPPRQKHVLPDGRLLTYRIYGPADGAPVVHFHNGLGMYRLNKAQHRQVERHALRMICVERPGFGLSDPRDDYSFETVAQDLAEFVDSLALRKTVFMADASGTPFAMATAKLVRTRIQSVLISAGRPGGSPRPTPATLKHFPVYFYDRLKRNPWLIDAYWAIMRTSINHALGRDILKKFFKTSPNDTDRLTANEIQDQMLMAVKDGMLASSAGVAAEFKYFINAGPVDISDFPSPIHFWHGAEDTFSPPDELITYAKTCPTATVTMLPGVGHLIGASAWDRVTAELRGLADLP